jgi:rubrerythrin
MDEKKFQEIVQFAIEKEIEAVDFYTRASQVVKYSGTKDLFIDFAKQEQGHKKLLEDLDLGKVVRAKIEKIPDLKISDYLVDTDFRPEISYADILRIAMKREEHSIKLYKDLKPLNGDETLTKVFNFLIQEETKHKYSLEKIYDDEVLK